MNSNPGPSLSLSPLFPLILQLFLLAEGKSLKKIFFLKKGKGGVKLDACVGWAVVAYWFQEHCSWGVVFVWWSCNVIDIQFFKSCDWFARFMWKHPLSEGRRPLPARLFKVPAFICITKWNFSVNVTRSLGEKKGGIDVNWILIRPPIHTLLRQLRSRLFLWKVDVSTKEASKI